MSSLRIILEFNKRTLQFSCTFTFVADLCTSTYNKCMCIKLEHCDCQNWFSEHLKTVNVSVSDTEM